MAITMATVTMEQLQSREPLKQTTIIGPNPKDHIEIAENVPRLLSLHTFTKAFSKSRRGFGLRRQDKAALQTADRPQVQTSNFDVNGGERISRQPSDLVRVQAEPLNLDLDLVLAPELEQPAQNGPNPVSRSLGSTGESQATERSPADHLVPTQASFVDAHSADNSSVAHIHPGPSLTSNSNGQTTQQNSVHDTTSEMTDLPKNEIISTGRLSETAERSLRTQHDIQDMEAGEQPRESFSLPQQSPILSDFPPQPVVADSDEVSRSETVTINQMTSAPPVFTQAYKSPTRTISILSRPRGVPIFGKMSNDIFEARRLRADEEFVRQWTTSWKPTIMRRLRDMHLGPHAITNLRFCMMGSSPDERNMKPTILVVCIDSKRREVEMGLSNFIRVSIPTTVDFKVVSGVVKLASGVPLALDEDKLNLGARIRFTAPEDLITLVGMQMRVQARNRRALYPICTVGGIINVGNTVYALSVAHSMFGSASEIEDHYSTLDWVSFGKVKSYEWSGNDTQDVALNGGTLFLDRQHEQTGMDWILVRLRSGFMLPNIFNDPHDRIRRNVSGFWNSVNLEGGDVYVCGGITGTQFGILDKTPTLILHGDVPYEVLSIALEHPLGMLFRPGTCKFCCNTLYSRWRFWCVGYQR
jgi:hypothetical protein